MKELIIGSHVSFNKDSQLLGSVKEAISYGANSFMFYTGAPQNTNRSSIDNNLTKEAWNLMNENGIDIKNVIVHAPYIVNLANPVNHDFSINFFNEELKRTEELGIDKIVLHPGSHVNLGEEEGIKNIINALNNIITDKTNVTICIETMAGKGSELGYNFKQIKQIIDGVNKNERLMVCLDTCHLNDAGYNVNEFDKLLEEFDKIIGIDKIACVHINDSKNSISAHKDRHENFGLGTLGFETLISIIYNDKLKDVPKILETPYVTSDDDSKERLYPPYKFEIEMIKNKKNNHNLINDIRNYYK